MNYTTLRLSGIGEIPVSAAEGSAAQVSLTGRQALALLRILERNRAALEREAEAERDHEYGRGPGVHAAEVPQKIRKGDPRLGKRAITYGDHTLDGKVTAIFRYSNGAEQIEVTQRIRVQGERCKSHPSAGGICITLWAVAGPEISPFLIPHASFLPFG
jgi:hypothetical protein